MQPFKRAKTNGYLFHYILSRNNIKNNVLTN